MGPYDCSEAFRLSNPNTPAPFKRYRLAASQTIARWYSIGNSYVSSGTIARVLAKLMARPLGRLQSMV